MFPRGHLRARGNGLDPSVALVRRRCSALRPAIARAMPTPAISLEVLPAGFGVSLLICCPVGRRTWRMLIDNGPDETYPALKARLAELRPNRRGKRHIDLFIVSHTSERL